MALGKQFRNLATSTALPLLVLLGCSSDPTIPSGDDAETIMGGSLTKVENARSDLAYVDPYGDYGRYTKVYIAPLDVDNVEIIQSNASTSAVNRYNTEWQLTDSDKQKLQEAFHESMSKELADGDAFEISETGGDDVLTIEAMLTSIAPSGPKDDAASRTAGRTRVYTEGGGGMSISIMLADGDSGEVLAIIKDTRNSNNSNWGINNSVTNFAEVRRNFNAWGRQIHDGLLGLKARAEANM